MSRTGLLEGRVAAITGGTAGIGLGIAQAFLAEGAKVALMARNEVKAKRTLESLGAGERACFIQGDAMRQSDVEGFVNGTADRFGQVDVLVNNAGGAGDLKPLVELSDETWEETITWNLHSTFWGTRAALKQMLPREWGRIINISSVEGKVGKPVLSPYTAAKHAVNGMTKSVAQEVGTSGITVNAICPGLVITDIVRDNGPRTAASMGMSLDEMIAMFSQESAIKRPNTVEEIAALAVMLASDAGAGITGACMSVDGGTAPY